MEEWRSGEMLEVRRVRVPSVKICTVQYTIEYVSGPHGKGPSGNGVIFDTGEQQGTRQKTNGKRQSGGAIHAFPSVRL